MKQGKSVLGKWHSPQYVTIGIRFIGLERKIRRDGKWEVYKESVWRHCGRNKTKKTTLIMMNELFQKILNNNCVHTEDWLAIYTVRMTSCLGDVSSMRDWMTACIDPHCTVYVHLLHKCTSKLETISYAAWLSIACFMITCLVSRLNLLFSMTSKQ